MKTVVTNSRLAEAEKEFVRKLVSVERELSVSKGRFRLFALTLREDSSDKWDLLLSAAWVQRNKAKATKLVSTEVRRVLTPAELLALSRIVIVNVGSPSLQAFNRTVHTEHGMIEITNSVLFGLAIRHAYIITSQRSL